MSRLGSDEKQAVAWASPICQPAVNRTNIIKKHIMKKFSRLSPALVIVGCLLLGGTNFVFGAAAKKKLILPNPDFTQGGKRGEDHDWTLGPTGARGWIYASKGQSSEARQILVTAVAKGSPADGVLNSGDVILGLDGKKFSDDARVQFSHAITAAEEEKNGGILRVTRWRAGKTDTVPLKLKVMGTYSDTAPFDCPKSKKVFEMGCEAIAKRGLGSVSIPNDMNALALLASGKPQYRPLLADYAKQVSVYEADGMATWYYGYANMFLAEYVMATGDRSVFEGMKRLALESARGQSAVGTWGHKFARPDGNLNGYGCMNEEGLSLLISMVLAREAGVKDPVLDRAIAKGAAFLRWYVDKGAIPYGDHQPWPGHEDNGKCSSATVLFDLLGDREAAEFFAKMSAASYSERERGHTGNYFNMVWALPGVIRCGPLTSGAYLKEQSWYYDLARGWDGSVAYPGSPVGEEEHGKYTKWDCTGSYLLGFAAAQKSLYLTGKKPFTVAPLNRAQTADVIAAGRDYFASKEGYTGRSAEQLLAGLSSWSPAVRKRSAKGLGQMPGDFVPTLTKMLTNPDRDTRYGACEALGCLGTRADAAAPQLRALLKDSDPWLQSLACFAIVQLGESVRAASVPDLLNLAAASNPADSRHMAQRAVSVALFAPFPGTRGTKSILAESLDGVDHRLLIPAVESVLQNEDSVTRGAVGHIYGKLTDHDLAMLLPSILKATEHLAPSDEMFGDGIRLKGLELLSRLHIREAMPLCLSVIEPNRWGSGKRLEPCLEYLCRYGTHAKMYLPQLRELRNTLDDKKGENSEAIAAVDKSINKIQASTVTPKLVGMNEFMANAK